MPGDQKFKILISTEHDPAGINAAKAGLEQVNDATEKGTKLTESARHEVDKMEVSHRALHGTIRKVTEDSPLMGIAMETAAFGATGAVMGITEGLELLNQWLAKAVQKLDDMAVAAVKDFGNVTEEIRIMQREMLVAKIQFEQWQKSGEQVAETLNEKLRRQLDIIHEIADEIQRAVNASGGTSPSKGQEDADAQRRRKSDLTAADEAVRQAYIDRDKAEKAAAAAHTAAEPKASTEVRKKELQQAKEDLKKAKDERDAADIESGKRHDAITTVKQNFPGADVEHSFLQQRSDEADKEAQTKADIYEKQKKVVEKAEKAADADATDQARRSAAAKDALDKANKARSDFDAVSKTRSQIDEQYQAGEVAARYRRVIGNFGKPASELIKGESGVADRVLSGQPITDQQARDLTSVGSAMTGHAASVAESAKAIHDAMKSNSQFAQGVAHLAEVMDNVSESFGKANTQVNTAISNVEKRVRQLEAQTAGNTGPR